MTAWNTPFTLTAQPLNEATYDENKARRMCQEKVNEIHDRFTRLEKKLGVEILILLNWTNY